MRFDELPHTLGLLVRHEPEVDRRRRFRWNRVGRKLAHRGLRNVILFEQDAATLVLPDASVDVIVSNLGINNFDDPPAVLRACFRLARPGATLLLTSNLVGHMAEFYDVYRATLIELGQHDRLPALDAHIQHRLPWNRSPAC